jgi:hypothetical protein
MVGLHYMPFFACHDCKDNTSSAAGLKIYRIQLSGDELRPEGSWVHAYLHRKEGDQGNAAYWYRRAGKPVCREPLDAEWVSIVRDLLGRSSSV